MKTLMYQCINKLFTSIIIYLLHNLRAHISPIRYIGKAIITGVLFGAFLTTEAVNHVKIGILMPPYTNFCIFFHITSLEDVGKVCK